MRGFYDPSVNFELEFDVKQDEVDELPAEQPPQQLEDTAKSPASGAKKPEPRKKAVTKTPETVSADAPNKGADVVSLDAFRKK